jgi:hypothetical protein
LGLNVSLHAERFLRQFVCYPALPSRSTDKAPDGTSFDLSPSIDDIPAPQERSPSLYDAFDVNEFDLALRIITADPLTLK